MTNQTAVKLTLDATGYTASLDGARRSLTAFQETQAAAAERVRVAQQAIAEAAQTGSTASARAINNFVSQLQRTADQAGKTRAELLEMKAAQLGVVDSVSGYIQQIASAAEETHNFSLNSSAARRELLVLAHEASQGSWKRFGGSLMVMAEATDALSLILSPVGIGLGVAAGAAALFAKELYAGYEQAEAFNKSITATGGALGLSVGQMAEMSNGLQTSGTNLAAVREAMAQVAATGAFTADNLSLATQAAVAMSSDIGIGVDKAAESLAKIQDNVIGWLTQYQQAHHTFNAAQVEEIEGFVKLGDTASAVNAIMRDLATAHAAVEADANAHMGAVVDWWHQLEYSVTRAKNAIMSIGVPDSIDKQVGDQYARVEAAQRNLAQQQSMGALGNLSSAQQSLDIEQRKLDVLRQQQTAVNVQQRTREAAARSGDAKVAVSSYLQSDKYASPAQKQSNDLQAENEAFNKATKDLDKNSADYQAALKRHYDDIGQINEQYAKRTRPHDAENGLNGELARLAGVNKLIEDEEKRHAATLKAQRDAGVLDAGTYLQKVHDLQATALDQEIANAAQRADIARGKKEQAAYETANTEYQRLVAQRKQIDTDLTDSLSKLSAARAANVSKFADQQQNSLRKQLSGYSDAYNTRDMTADAKSQYDAQAKLVEQYQQTIAALREQYSGPTADLAEYQAKMQVAQQYYEEETAALEQNLQTQQALRDSYGEQFKKTYAGLVGSAQTNAEATASAFKGAFDAIGSGIDAFVTTGKLSFDTFAAGVIADLAKIALHQAEVAAFKGLSSAFFSTGGPVGHYADGGSIVGPGTGTSDSIPAMLSNGEYVINAASTKKYRSLLESINSGRTSHFASGGAVGAVSGASTPANHTTELSLNLQGGSLSPADLAAIAPQLQAVIDKRINQRFRGQGGMAWQMKYGQV
ncbi:phage tail length tape measure family protein [Paraburkholderia sp. SARCC-3016]|uniref:phage tail length tape measure family protein n=1 Tax=Paraburkholderia sp. SARCC-3016 TaxID=3058611 RepID=UPI00280946C3|nr:phage tail length tape measure family protein [Paraburkholderia sp. SARCC-3016]MDQ7982171.1 phage tail length tape measure family protein [Paraburkholderia sp. SARCC-3016]